ncbi:nitroreductase family protein [Virgibacillus byunsanensis]|uniref:Nitroreductase family protein n=1 Tax=Virgibacillus byunsanensis TaxID=570945 RepID=A0ABW3LME6_9BACI
MSSLDSKRETYIDLLNEMKQVINVRNFSDQKIETYKLNILFEAFSYGPSLANQQPWEVLELSTEQISKVVQATVDPFFTDGTENGQAWLKDAPYVCVVLNDIRRSEARLGEIGTKIASQDSFSALQNLRVFAQLEGLGTSVVREFDSKRLKKVLRLPKAFSPVAIVAIGYPIDRPELPPRLTYTDFVHEGGVDD